MKNWNPKLIKFSQFHEFWNMTPFLNQFCNKRVIDIAIFCEPFQKHVDVPTPTFELRIPPSIHNVWHWIALRPKKRNILFACPHPTDPDFEILKVFLPILLYNEYWLYFWKFLKKEVFLFCNFCTLKCEKNCVLEVCV